MRALPRPTYLILTVESHLKNSDRDTSERRARPLSPASPSHVAVSMSSGRIRRLPSRSSKLI